MIPIDLAVDSAGTVNATGHFSTEVDFGGGARNTDANQAALVVQLDEHGAYRWDWTYDFDGGGLGHAVAVDSSNSVFVTGEFHGSLSFADTEHAQDSDLRGYVLGFDGDGTERWARTFGGTGHVRPFGLAVDAGDRVLVAGYFSDEAIFGEAPRVSAGGDDVFALMLTNSGENLWDRTQGGPGDETGRAIARGCTGTIFVGGRDPGNDSGNLVSMDALLLAFD